MAALLFGKDLDRQEQSAAGAQRESHRREKDREKGVELGFQGPLGVSGEKEEG